MTHYQPCNDYVLVRPDRPLTQVGSIHIPEGIAANRAITRGTVIAVGPGLLTADGRRHPPAVAPDDRVEYLQSDYPQVTDEDGARLLLVREELLLAVVTGEPVDLEICSSV